MGNSLDQHKNGYFSKKKAILMRKLNFDIFFLGTDDFP